MKTLYLLRHAKSSWKFQQLEDIERPLNRRGMNDAPKMGARFLARQESVELFITSPAKRAQITAQLFAEASGNQKNLIRTDPALYFEGQNGIEQVIRAIKDSCNAVMLVFHNPDITAFANTVANDRINNLPTCGLIKIQGNIDHWHQWSTDAAAMIYFDYPKRLDSI